jgi:two-component system sensor histidine kinase KdpD
VYTLRVSDSGNWVALVVFIFTAVVVSELAARSRRRATEAATLAARADVLKQSDALKTALLRAVSHDLRSPLMAILTSSSTLAQHDFELDADDRRELLATITSEAGRLDRLVANLLDLSKLQAGAAVPNPDLWPLEELVGQALHELGAEAARVEVELPDREVAVKVDPGQIERVLANLIENALKYSPGAVSVAVSTAGGSVMVRVADHGAGISKDELERIFEPFHRGSSVGEARGAGLGLAIARGFAEANGGRVWAESRRGEGATFVLTLPAEQPVEVRV